MLSQLKYSISFCLLSLFFSCVQASDKCANVELQVLGAGGPEINDGLASSSYLVWVDGKARIMIDAGGGSSFNFERSGANFNDLNALLFSHFHVDHSAALPVYVKAGYFSGREDNLPVFGPSAGGDFPSTQGFVSALFSDSPTSVYAYLSDNITQQPSTDFLLKPVSIPKGNKIWQHKLTDKINLSAITVNHGPIPALAWRVDTKGCSVVFSGDTSATSNNLIKLAKQTDLLVAHNAIPENAHPAAKRLHMQPSRIGEVAEQSQAKRLLLSHFMMRSVDRKTESHKAIRRHYNNAIINAVELVKYRVNPNNNK